MMAVHARNSDSFWIVEHLAPGGSPYVLGFEAFLPLTRIGREMLEAGKLNGASPPLWAVAPTGEAPAALYIWAIVARRVAKYLSPLFARALGPLYKDAPLFAFVATEGGRKASVGSGFSGPDAGEISIGSFIRLPSWNERVAA
jgi:hypothetical protein